MAKPECFKIKICTLTRKFYRLKFYFFETTAVSSIFFNISHLSVATTDFSFYKNKIEIHKYKKIVYK